MSTSKTKALIGVVAAGSASVVISVPPVDATVYAPGLCSAGDNRRSITPSYIWGSYDRITNTSDYSGTEWSFRTCSWLGTNHSYLYSCTGDNTTSGDWKINIVGREPHGGGEVLRYDWTVFCTGQLVGVTVPTPHWNNSDIHYHLWSPSGTGCSACGDVIYNWGASVK
jgi:hypothetical protein